MQYQDVVATAHRPSICFTNHMTGRTADLAAHEAVKFAIEYRDPQTTRAAIIRIIDDIMELMRHPSAA